MDQFPPVLILNVLSVIFNAVKNEDWLNVSLKVLTILYGVCILWVIPRDWIFIELLQCVT